MKIDFTNKPEDSLEDLLAKYHPNMFLIMDDVLTDRHTYQFIFQQLIDILKLGFEVEEIRHRPIHFKFHAQDKKIHELPITNFISNLIIWYAFMEMDRTDLLEEKYIYDFKKFTINDICNYLDDEVLIHFEGDFHSKNKIIDEIWHNIRPFPIHSVF